MIGLIIAILRICELIIIIRALVSWIHPDPAHPLIRFIVEITEPVLEPFRKWMGLGGVDFSPIAIIVIIEILISLLGRMY
jgi:YggT family protein